MIESRYFASVQVNDVAVFKGFGDNLPNLIASLTAKLDQENSWATGSIVDKSSGETVYQCRKINE